MTDAKPVPARRSHRLLALALTATVVACQRARSPVDAAAAPPAAVHVHVAPEGFPPRTAVTFQYADMNAPRPPIAPCENASDCMREVPAGVALVVSARAERAWGVSLATPTRDGEEIRLHATALPEEVRDAEPPPRAPDASSAAVACGQVDPRTGLIRICFDRSSPPRVARPSSGRVPCGQLDPRTGLVRICFDHDEPVVSGSAW